MPGWRPRKVDCTGISRGGDVAVVMVCLFRRLDGEEQAAGTRAVGSASAASAS